MKRYESGSVVVRRILVALLLSVALQGAGIAAKAMLIPVHARGGNQVALSAVIAVADLVQAPGELAVFHFQLFDRLHWVAWVLRIGVNVLLGWVFFALLIGVRWPGRRVRRPVMAGDSEAGAKEGAAPAPRVSRRSLLTSGVRVATVGAAGVAGYGLLVDPFRLRVTRQVFPLRNLPRELEGLRIVQLTDIHHGPWFAMEHVREMVEQTNALDADLICLTGDYVHRSPRYVEPLAGALADLKARVGVVGVLGNHDWQEDAALTRRAFGRVGVRLIDNARVFVTPERRLAETAAGTGLCVAGVGDLWKHTQDYGAALGGLPEEMPRILLAHNPDTAEEAALRAGPRVDLMLSGHTHGGQVVVPGLGTPVLPSRFGQKYASGMVRGPVCPVYVSCGVGMALLPVRIGVLPEITVIEMKGA